MAKTEEAAPEAVDGYVALEVSLPENATIHQRMLMILAELPAIGKTQRNEQQKFMYRGHDDVMNALNPLLARHGVFVVPYVKKRVTAERTTGKGTTMYEVNLFVEYTFWGAAGDSLVAATWGEGTDMGDKSTNKAMTMALKNVLAQAFAISTQELSDADATSPEETTRGERTQPAGQRQGRRDRAEPFDPARFFLEGAPRNNQDIATALNALDPSLLWRDIIGQAVEHVYGTPDRTTLPEDKQFEVGVRLANTVVRMQQATAGGDFPPISDEQITAAFAEMFGGVQVTVPPPEPVDDPEALAAFKEAAAPDEDIQFPDGNDPATD